jgi:hypothetical protein
MESIKETFESGLGNILGYGSGFGCTVGRGSNDCRGMDPYPYVMSYYSGSGGGGGSGSGASTGYGYGNGSALNGDEI